MMSTSLIFFAKIKMRLLVIIKTFVIPLIFDETECLV